MERRHWATSLVLALAGAVLGFAVVSSAVSVGLQGTRPAKALAWDADNGKALDAVAEENLRAPSPEHLAVADEMAKRALVAAPLKPDGLRLLARVAEIRGASDRAQALMSEAGKRSWRDLKAQAWLLEYNLKAGRYPSASDNADALLRVDDALAPILFPALIQTALRPKGAAALEKTLARAPPWRTSFITALSNSPQGSAAVLPILSALKSDGSPPTNDEVTPYLEALLKQNKAQEAYLSWAMLLTKAQLGVLANVYDGQFSLPISNSPFDWVISPTEGASPDVEAPPSPHAGPALHVVYDGFSPNSGLIRQQIALSPGRYDLVGYVFTAMPETTDRVRWSISCSPSSAETVHSKPAKITPSRWMRFSYEFDVPDIGCAGQTLALLPQPGERQTSVDVWYDDVVIAPAA